MLMTRDKMVGFDARDILLPRCKASFDITSTPTLLNIYSNQVTEPAVNYVRLIIIVGHGVIRKIREG